MKAPSTISELSPLLLALGRAGIELAPHPTDAGRLRHRPAVPPPDLAARLQSHKPALLAILADGYSGVPHATGTPAWLLAVGGAMGGEVEAPAPVDPTPATRHPTRGSRPSEWLTARLVGRTVPIRSVEECASRDGVAWAAVVNASRYLRVESVTVGVERGGIKCWQLPPPAKAPSTRAGHTGDESGG